MHGELVLSECWTCVAQQELGESKERVTRELSRIRQLIEETEWSRSYTFYDDFLLRFLRARKFNVESAFKVLERYCDVIARYPQARQPSTLTHVFSQDLSCVLPDRDEQGRGVFMFRAGRWDPTSCSVWDILHANLACLELLVREPDTQVCGILAIVDMDGLSLKQARHFTPLYAKEVISLLQDCFPIRFKAIHFINEPRIFHLIYSILKPFLTEKLTKRMHFHGRDILSLHRHVNRNILPAELDGDSKPFSSNATFTELLRLEDLGWNNNGPA